MSPRSLVAVLAAVMFLSAACAPTPAVSFDPTGACTSDGSAPGAYPDLEALVPATYRDERPGTLDSGRHCSGPALGTLASAGIAEIRFAGATWSFGAERAAVLAVFEAPGLTADALADLLCRERTDGEPDPGPEPDGAIDRRPRRPPDGHQDR